MLWRTQLWRVAGHPGFSGPLVGNQWRVTRAALDGSALMQCNAASLFKRVQAPSGRRIRSCAHSVEMEYAGFRDTAVAAARECGGIIMEAWTKPRNITNKGAVDLVTETDVACEACVQGIIQNAYPEHKFIGEEGSSAQGFTPCLTDSPTWLVDPLDGTTNFVHQFPFVCVCIGLAVNKEVVVGVVYNPVLNELFTAIRGLGSTLNGAPICVSGQSDLSKALYATEIGVTRDDATVAAIFDRVQQCTKASRSMRATGSCAMNMCGVAMGRLDAYFEVGFGGPWDVAAASLIVEEAGGMLLDPSGSEFGIMSRRVLCATPEIAPQFAAIIKSCQTSPQEP